MSFAIKYVSYETLVCDQLEGFFQEQMAPFMYSFDNCHRFFLTLDWVNSFLLSNRDQNATSLLFWLRVAEIATSEASVWTVRGSFSLITFTGSAIFMATHILSRFSRKTIEIKHLLH